MANHMQKIKTTKNYLSSLRWTPNAMILLLLSENILFVTV